MKKWTYYYGGIRQVEILLNKEQFCHECDGDGSAHGAPGACVNCNGTGKIWLFGGFNCGGHGVVWESALRHLPANEFWETAEEAVVGIRSQLVNKRAELLILKNWMEKQIKIEASRIEALEKRISDVEKEVVK